jgi:hypothetical protein
MALKTASSGGGGGGGNNANIIRGSVTKPAGSGATAAATTVASKGVNKAKSNSFTGTTYSEAVAYMKSKGVPGANASGAMTASEWSRRRNSYSMTGQGGTEVKNYSSYQAYLRDYVSYCIEKFGK